MPTVQGQQPALTAGQRDAASSVHRRTAPAETWTARVSRAAAWTSISTISSRMLAGLRKKCVQTRGAYAGSVAADSSTMRSDEWVGCDRVIWQSWTPSMSLRIALEGDGHRVMVAADAGRALAILRHEAIEIMITDYQGFQRRRQPAVCLPSSRLGSPASLGSR